MPAVARADIVARALNGVVCLYKPAGRSIEDIGKVFISKICKELNELIVRPPRKMVAISGATNLPMKVDVVEDLRDHPLVVGPRYLEKDFKICFGSYLGKNTSGVCLYGINDGKKMVYNWRLSKPVHSYKICGQFGLATDSYFVNGKVVEKAQYKHVTRAKIDRVTAHMQAMHQRKMFEISGLDMSSQAGYELACRGLIRPTDSKVPVVYGIKCLEFNRPDFVIEVQSINEYENYLHTFIHDIGMQLKTVAHCTKGVRIREGIFTLEHALLMKHWTLQEVIDNIHLTEKLLGLHGKLHHQTPQLRIVAPEAELKLISQN